MALGRRVAVKTLLAETGHDPELTARFEREARAASAIGDPHIVDVFDLGRTPEGVLFMAMELLDGKPLATLLKETPCLPVPLAIDVACQILGGLAAAHRNGIAHRDLKPENIFIINTEDRPNFVKIVDFGISKILFHPERGPRTAGGTGTAVGTILGTPLYMSPEQILGQVAHIDHRTDIYSAGVVLYEMLCGCTPFEGESHAKIFASILDGWYPLPHDLRREIPPDVEAAIVRALDRDMGKRFATATAMREAITGSKRSKTDLTPAPEPMPDAPFLVQLQEEPTATPKFGRAVQPGSGESVDPFVPLPDHAVIPMLANNPDRPLPASTHPADLPIEVARPARTGSATMLRRPVAHHEAVLSSKTRSRIGMALAVVALIVVARVAYSYFQPANGKNATVHRRVQHKVTLAVDPAEASVQIDNLPAMRDDLFLDEGAPHVLVAAAPGRITRKFSIEAKADLELSLHLGRALALPSPAEPEPSRGELALEYPANPASHDEINHAFAKLDRYARCLALLGYTDGDARRGGNSAGPSNSDMSACIRLVEEANTLAPEMFPLRAAVVAYLQGVQSGQNPVTLHKLLAAFRAEYLAARTRWQLEELSRQEKDDGRTAAWHMRRVALAAQAWLRQSKTAAASARGTSRARLDDALQSLLEFARHSSKGMAQVSGADAFTKSAQDVVALARSESGKRSNSAAALADCRQLLGAFNALVVE